MSELEVIEEADRLEIRSPMRNGKRVLFALLGLFPLIAPFELLIQVDWRDYLSPFFLLAAVVSVGALVLSGLLFFAAVAGLSSIMAFDAANVAYTSWAPVVRRSHRSFPVSAVEDLEVGVREWSDGPPTFHLRVTVTGGSVFESGSSWSRDEIEAIRERVEGFLSTR